jgi:hypothetical protein
MGKFGYLLDVSACSAQSIKYSFKISAILHRNNSQLIFFVNPHEECLVLIMENTSSIGPVSVQADCLEESVSLLK